MSEENQKLRVLDLFSGIISEDSRLDLNGQEWRQ